MNTPSVLIAALTLTSAGLFAADALSADQQEEFMRTAKVMNAVSAKKGVTGTVRVTLSDGKITHDASVQRVDQSVAVFQPQGGPTEYNFKDSYLFNIAGWKLAKLLGLDDMVPVSVARGYRGMSAAFTWWIDDVAMDEGERQSKKIEPPDPDSWSREIQVLHVFDQLIYNTDSNATNLLIDGKWHIWMIDHSRAFRRQKTLRNPEMLSRCDRSLLAKMKTLDEATVQKEMKGYLDKSESQGLLARRDLIVKFFDGKGEAALFDRPARH
jgi:hypothetical protein